MAQSRRDFVRTVGLGSAGLSTAVMLGGTREALALTSPEAAAAAEAAADVANIRLSSNENNRGPGQKAREMLHNAITTGIGRGYPPDHTADLADTIAAVYKVDTKSVIIGTGSGPILEGAVVAFCATDKPLVTAAPTYATCENTAKRLNVPVKAITVDKNMQLDLAAMADAARGAGLVIVCNPNNPTGSISPPAELAWLLAHKPTTTRVLVDEAYLQYSDQPSLIAEVAQRDDLIVLRTFSKLYGMAGLRLGVAAAHPDRLRELARLGDNPLPVPALAAGLASLQDRQLVAQRRLQNAKARQATIAWLGKRGFSCLPSEANCFVVDVQRDGAAFAKAMAENGVVIGRSWPIWPQHVRVTVGSEDEMAAFRRAFAKVAGVPA